MSLAGERFLRPPPHAYMRAAFFNTRLFGLPRKRGGWGVYPPSSERPKAKGGVGPSPDGDPRIELFLGGRRVEEKSFKATQEEGEGCMGRGDEGIRGGREFQAIPKLTPAKRKGETRKEGGE